MHQHDGNIHGKDEFIVFRRGCRSLRGDQMTSKRGPRRTRTQKTHNPRNRLLHPDSRDQRLSADLTCLLQCPALVLKAHQTQSEQINMQQHEHIWMIETKHQFKVSAE